MKLPDSLITTLSENSNNLLPIIGAGVSMSIKSLENETIFPSWKELLEEAAEKIRNENDIDNANLVETFLRKNDYQEAAKYAYEGLKNGLWHNFIKEKFDPDLSTLDPKSSDLSKAIWKISNKIITLNYDRTLIWAHPTDSAGVEILTNSSSANLPNILNNNTTPLVWYLHGHVNDTAKLILTPASYSKLYPTSNETEIEYKAALQVLKSVLSTKSLLFIGCSLDDADLLSEMTKQHNMFSGNCKPHYALIKESNKQEIYNKLKDTNIKIITFSEYGQPLIDIINKITSYITKDTIPLATTSEKNIIVEKPEKNIAFLSASPIGHDPDYQPILKELRKFSCDIECLPLTIDNLQDLSQYDYIFIATTSVKNRLIIEDEYYCLEKITIQDLQNNSDLCDKKGVFIFTDNHINKGEVKNINFPALILPIINTDKYKKITSSINFQLFKKGNLSHYKDIGVIKNEDKFIFSSKHKNTNTNTNKKNKIISNKTNIPSSINKNISDKFIGRYEDLVALSRKIARLKDDNGFITIKGSGGLGKTTIAKILALKLSEKGEYKGGINFIDCEHLINYEQFKFHIASTFNLEQAQDLEDHLTKHFDNENRLIILDNFEPLLYLDDKYKILELLNFMAEYSSIIITSREFLKIDGEMPYTLRQMTSDEAIELFTNSLGNRKLTSDEKDLVKNKIIDELLNKNPLAITVITSNILPNKNLHTLHEELRLKFFEISEIDLDLFDNSTDTNIDRKKSIYGSILYSYNMLKEEEKKAFEKLSLFPDGINPENFKKLNKKLDTNEKEKEIISDRILKKLQNKSLIQEHQSDIKLQSIIGRFAERMFNKRDDKVASHNAAFKHNHTIAKSLGLLISEDNVAKHTTALKIYDRYINNFLKTISDVDKSTVKTKYKIEFIQLCSDFFVKLCSLSSLIDLLRDKAHVFSGTELDSLQIAIEYCRYYNGDFEDSFKNIKSIIPIDKLTELNINITTERNIFTRAMNIYCMEGNQAYIYNILQDSTFENTKFSEGIRIGILGKNKPSYQDLSYFEEKHISQSIDITEIDNHINSLHEKQHIARMQVSYVRSKVKLLNRIDIEKLVVVNPYTFGLKNLMFAFSEQNLEKAKAYYLTSIKNLEHIKYFYVEAIYMYSLFLKENNFIEFDDTYSKGRNLSKKYYYRYIEYLFDELKSPSNRPYNQETYPLPNFHEFNEITLE
jgi:predicted ATPase